MVSGTGEQEEARRYFRTTQWSVVIAAGGESSTDARRALQTLCERYWYPLYFFIRRKGFSLEEAEDLTQGFFEHLLTKNTLAKVERGRGRFRSFLLRALDYYVSDEWDRSHARKRGGKATILSLDVAAAENLYGLNSATDLTPEKLYERQWATTLLDRVKERLKDDYTRQGKHEIWEHLAGILMREEDANSYRQAAKALGMTYEAALSGAYRMRKKLRQFLREEVAETVGNQDEVDGEMRNLWAVFD